MNLKKVATTALATLGSMAVMAEESSGGTGSSTVGESIITEAQGTLEGLLGTAGSAVVSIIGVGLAIWAGIAIVGLIKRSFNAGKGR